MNTMKQEIRDQERRKNIDFAPWHIDFAGRLCATPSGNEVDVPPPELLSSCSKKGLTMKNTLLIVIVSGIVATLSAQDRGQGRGRGGQAPRGAEPLVMDDRTGFESIFDGSTLKGWDGDSAFWRVENGAIVGQSTPENAVKQNTFLIWRGGEPRNFELKVQFRIEFHQQRHSDPKHASPDRHAGGRYKD